MRLISVFRFLWFLGLLTSFLACKHESQPQPVVCRLTSVTDQVVEIGGRLTTQIQRVFLYHDGRFVGLKERTSDGETTFETTYSDERIVQLTGESTRIRFAYAPDGSTSPGSATVLENDQVRSTFAIEYLPSGQLSRISERRQVLPVNTSVSERVYTFTYDKAGNLTGERARFTFRDGFVVEQETQYTVGTNPAPYTHLNQRNLLTVVALSRATETLPSRFWHLNAPVAHQTYDLNADGSRGTLRESVTYGLTYDTDKKPTTQDLTSLLYQSGTPGPLTKKTRQTFDYQCN